MDNATNELDRVPPPPEQEQLSGIVDLVDSLTQQGTIRENLWRERDFPDLNIGATARMFVSWLTPEGEATHPEFPLVVVRAFNRDGRSEIDYQISRQGNQLRIDKHESVRTEEDELEAWEWRRKYRMEDFAPEKALEAAIEIRERYNRSVRNRKFEKQIGFSYVDAQEAQRLIDNLSKLKEKTKVPLIRRVGKLLRR